MSSNANLSTVYGRGKDRYVPKKEFGQKVICAGEYILQELEHEIAKAVENLDSETKSNIEEIFSAIDEMESRDDLRQIIARKYTPQNGELPINKAHPRRGIVYSKPNSRISKYQSLDENQTLEVNLYARWRRAEEKKVMEEYREQIAKLRSYGLGLKKNDLRVAKQKRDEAKERNQKAKQLEQEVFDQLEQRRNIHEEQ